MDFSLKDLEVSMVVTTPYKNLPHITMNKRYIIHKIEDEYIWVMNDYGHVTPYKAFHFIEVDTYYSLCFYLTVVRLLQISSKPLDLL